VLDNKESNSLFLGSSTGTSTSFSENPSTKITFLSCSWRTEICYCCKISNKLDSKFNWML